MKTYYYCIPSLEYIQGNYIDAESVGKARYKIWLEGAGEYFETFGEFIKLLKIRVVKVAATL